MKYARMLTPEEIEQLLEHVSHKRHSIRDKAMVLLSFKAGLRAMEIAGLTWNDVAYDDGEIREELDIRPEITKKSWGWGSHKRSKPISSTRLIPIGMRLRDALTDLYRLKHKSDRVIYSERSPNFCLSPNAVAVWFHIRYREIGIQGASSHSGRRTFITAAARSITLAGGSLKDVQELAGHSSLNMTQRYIETSPEAKQKVVDMV